MNLYDLNDLYILNVVLLLKNKFVLQNKLYGPKPPTNVQDIHTYRIATKNGRFLTLEGG
jgi:hypothetical protein